MNGKYELTTNEKIKAFCIALSIFTLFYVAIWTSSAIAIKAETTTQLETTEFESITEIETTTEVETTTEAETTTEKPYKTIIVTATAYCPCHKCCGKSDGITASGTKATAGRTIAVDPKFIPYGTKIEIDGHTYIAEDCGGAIKGNRIDIFFATHEEALNFGKRQIEIKIYS